MELHEEHKCSQSTCRYTISGHFRLESSYRTLITPQFYQVPIPNDGMYLRVMGKRVSTALRHWRVLPSIWLTPGLKLRLHMSALVSLGEHEASLLMLLAHDTLESIQSAKALSIEEVLIFEVWEANVNILPLVWPSLEPHHAVPCLKCVSIHIYIRMVDLPCSGWQSRSHS
jgi:hypothetical protein